jgi:hypothetical protein
LRHVESIRPCVGFPKRRRGPKESKAGSRRVRGRPDLAAEGPERAGARRSGERRAPISRVSVGQQGFRHVVYPEADG